MDLVLPSNAERSSGTYRTQHADDIVFLIAFGVWLSASVINYQTFFAIYLQGLLFEGVRWVCAALLLISEALSVKRGIKWTKKSIIGLAVIVVLGVCCYNAGRIHMVWNLPFFFCARNRDYKAIFTVAIGVFVAALIIVSLCGHVGVIQNVINNAGGRSRNYIGFRYALDPSMLMFSITCMLLAVESFRLNVPMMACLLLANVFLFLLTDSRLSFYLSVAAVCIVCFATKFEGTRINSRMLALLLSFPFVICAIVTIVATLAYDPSVSWMVDLNAKLGNRLSLCHEGFQKYGITMLGNNIRLVGGSLSPTGQQTTAPYFFIDSAYLQYLLIYGFVYFSAFLVASTVFLYQSHRSGRLVICALLLIIALHGVIDCNTIYLWACPFICVFSSLMSENQLFRWGSDQI